ncbi:MAG: hypothetical protein RMK30_08810 [Anaerolineae bacterium]|nr:hypothetical protein [Anaerolineae bacterium]
MQPDGPAYPGHAAPRRKPTPAQALTSTPAPGETTTSAIGRIFYVALHGDNANPGTRDHPWATPGYGSRQLQPGDTLITLGSRYVLSQYPDDIIIPPSGTPTA